MSNIKQKNNATNDKNQRRKKKWKELSLWRAHGRLCGSFSIFHFTFDFKWVFFFVLAFLPGRQTIISNWWLSRNRIDSYNRRAHRIMLQFVETDFRRRKFRFRWKRKKTCSMMLVAWSGCVWVRVRETFSIADWNRSLSKLVLFLCIVINCWSRRIELKCACAQQSYLHINLCSAAVGPARPAVSKINLSILRFSISHYTWVFFPLSRRKLRVLFLSFKIFKRQKQFIQFALPQSQS